MAEIEREMRQWQATFNAINDAIALLDMDGRILKHNRAFRELTGKSDDEITGRFCFRLIHHTDTFIEGCPFVQALASLKRESLEMKLLDKWFQVTVDPVFNEAGEAIGFVHVMSDITQSKRAEEKLKKSEHFLSESQRIAKIGSWDMNIETGKIIWSDEMYRIYHAAPHAFEHMAEAFIKLIHPEDREAMLQWIEATEAGEKRDELEFRIIAPDGTIRFIRGAGEPVFDDAGRVIRMVGTAQDITERKKAEDALKEAESRLSSLAQTASDAIIMADSNGDIISWNSGAQKIFGYSESEVQGKALTILMPERYIEDHTNGIKRIITTGQSQYLGNTLEFHGIRKDRTEFPLELSVSAWVRNKEFYFMGIIRDITERKKLEKALFESEKRLKTIISTEPHCVKLINADGTLIEMNPAGLTIIEADSFEQVKGASLYSLISPNHRSAFKAHVNEVFAGGSGTLEFELIGLKGTRRWLSTHSVPFRNSEGEIIALLGITQDISESRRLEEQLREAQKLEGIGQLAGGIAHDFNNILTAVVGFGGMLQMQMDDADPSKHYVSEILAAGQKGASLTHQILAFSRKQVLDMKPVNLNEIIRSLDKMLHRLVREDIAIDLNLSGNGLVVLADTSQIDQVIINLVTNARDAMPRGGKITIAAEPFIMDDAFVEMHGYGRAGEYALITVSDTGIGMDAGTQLHIFEPFFTTKETGKGTGLGLAVVHGIVKQHNGYINVYSEAGKGTAFRIYLPLTEHAVEGTIKESTVPVKRGNETILVAEDEQSLRKLTKIMLESAGYRVLTAKDGKEAADIYKEHAGEIDLVVLDVIMPVMNGEEAFGEMRRLNPSLKALFMSGYTRDTISDHGIAEGQYSFVQKPVRLEPLLSKIREVLNGAG